MAFTVTFPTSRPLCTVEELCAWLTDRGEPFVADENGLTLRAIPMRFVAAPDQATLQCQIEVKEMMPVQRMVDVVFDVMIHDIDLVLSRAQAPVQRINAVGSAMLSPTIDAADARALVDAVGDGALPLAVCQCAGGFIENIVTLADARRVAATACARRGASCWPMRTLRLRAPRC